MSQTAHLLFLFTFHFSFRPSPSPGQDDSTQYHSAPRFILNEISPSTTLKVFTSPIAPQLLCTVLLSSNPPRPSAKKNTSYIKSSPLYDLRICSTPEVLRDRSAYKTLNHAVCNQTIRYLAVKIEFPSIKIHTMARHLHNRIAPMVCDFLDLAKNKPKLKQG